MENNYNFLSTRKGFNASLNHFKLVNLFIKECERFNNLADLINESIDNNALKKYEIKSLINVLLVDKFHYCCKSQNLNSIYTGSFEKLSAELIEWNLFDFVIIYFHPQLGITAINPKNVDSWKSISGELKENELIVIYAGFFGKEFDPDLAKKACDSLAELIQNGKVKDTKIFKVDSFEYPKYEPKKIEKKEQAVISSPAGSTASKQLSARIGIVVTNELFHNGNVEAWKKIIESYETKYPDTEVLVFYDNEQIHDINTLFKWGKVKNGTMIFICLLGPEFRNLSKLRRYLLQGASPRFEAFLKGSPGQILPLF